MLIGIQPREVRGRFCAGAMSGQGRRAEISPIGVVTPCGNRSQQAKRWRKCQPWFYRRLEAYSFVEFSEGAYGGA
jgi:hypothetical protein